MNNEIQRDESFYAILKSKLDLNEKIEDYAVKCDSLEMASKYPHAEYIVQVKDIPAINEGGYLYGYCYEISIFNLHGAPYLLCHGKANCRDFRFVVKGQGLFKDDKYNYFSEVYVLDKQKKCNKKIIWGGIKGQKLRIVQEILGFLKEFDLLCKGDWDSYNIREEKKKEINSIKEQIATLQNKLMNLENELDE